MQNLEVNVLKFPEMRVNLIAYVKSLSDEHYQKQYWGKFDPNNPNFYDDFDESIHYLYDTMGLDNEPESWLGLVFKSESEVKLVRVLIANIESLFHNHGLSLTDKQYMETEEWQPILCSAKKLYLELI